MSLRKRLTPHQRIIRAAAAGVGLRLSPIEVEQLAADDAISTAASNDDDGYDSSGRGGDWPDRLLGELPHEPERIIKGRRR